MSKWTKEDKRGLIYLGYLVVLGPYGIVPALIHETVVQIKEKKYFDPKKQ